MAKEIQVTRYQCEHCNRDFETGNEATHHENVCRLIEEFIQQGDFLFVRMNLDNQSDLKTNALFYGPIRDLSSDVEGVNFLLVEVTGISVKNDNSDVQTVDGDYGIYIQYRVINMNGIVSEYFTDHLSDITREKLIYCLESFLQTGVYKGEKHSFFGKQALTDEQISEIREQLRQIEKSAHYALTKLE